LRGRPYIGRPTGTSVHVGAVDQARQVIFNAAYAAHPETVRPKPGASVYGTSRTNSREDPGQRRVFPRQCRQMTG